MPITLLVLDIDGTMVGKQLRINEPVLKAIKAAQAVGVQVAVATGRMYRAALRFHAEVGSTLPLISYQGALIKDPKDGTVLMHRPVPIDRTLEVIDFMENNELVVHLYINDTLYVRELTPASRRYGERTGVEPEVVGDLRRVLTAEPTKVLGLTPGESVTDRMLKLLAERYSQEELYLTKSDPTFVEVANPHANKGLAVRFLAEEILQIPSYQVMTVGDQLNDAEMIVYAGTGVAMGNAPAALQVQADWIAPTVEQDGVAAAIEKFILTPQPCAPNPSSTSVR